MLAVALLLAACATEPRPRQAPPSTAPGGEPSVRSVMRGGISEALPLPPEEALARAQRALTARGLTVVNPGAAGRALDARGQGLVSTGWADCPRLMTRDPSAEAFRGRRVEPTELRLSVTTSAAASADGSNVTISVTPIGIYLNSYTYTPEQGPCRSTGVLERELLDAIRQG
jgi:hypothetical protein